MLRPFCAGNDVVTERSETGGKNYCRVSHLYMDPTLCLSPKSWLPAGKIMHSILQTGNGFRALDRSLLPHANSNGETADNRQSALAP